MIPTTEESVLSKQHFVLICMLHTFKWLSELWLQWWWKVQTQKFCKRNTCKRKLNPEGGLFGSQSLGDHQLRCSVAFRHEENRVHFHHHPWPLNKAIPQEKDNPVNLEYSDTSRYSEQFNHKLALFCNKSSLEENRERTSNFKHLAKSSIAIM